MSGTGYRTDFAEDGAAVAIADTDATLIDVDSPNLTSLTVTLINLLDAGQEVLSANTSGTAIVGQGSKGGRW